MDTNDSPAGKFSTFDNARYAALTSLWAHQNTTRFQWVPVMFTVALVFVSFVLTGDELVGEGNVSILSRTSWGSVDRVRWGAGMPLMLAGIGTALMAYSMQRSRRVMDNVVQAINQLENGRIDPDDWEFGRLNKPNGFRASTFIHLYMLLLAAAITGFASLLVVGWRIWAVGLWFMLVVGWSVVELSPKWLPQWASQSAQRSTLGAGKTKHQTTAQDPSISLEPVMDLRPGARRCDAAAGRRRPGNGIGAP